MKPLGLGHFTFLELTPVALIRLAARTGYGAVGLRFHPFAPGAPHYLPGSARARAEIAHALDGEGVSLFDIETVVIDEAFRLDALAPVIEAAHALGAKRVNVCADDHPGAREAFGEVCEMAAAAGMGVDLECMAWRGVNSVGAAMAMVGAAPNAGFLVDALHLARCGGTPGDLAAIDPARIVAAQLCDAPAMAPDSVEGIIAEARGGRMIPGEGGLPLGALLSALPEHAFLSVELPMANDPRPPAARAAAIFAATMALIDAA